MQVDAFRHAYANAMLIYQYGSTQAFNRLVFDQWERNSQFDRPRSFDVRDRNMDLWNNSIGRQIGQEKWSRKSEQRYKWKLRA